LIAGMKKPEILAPAGNRPCLAAALHAGADAVYFGLRGLNMRAQASRSFGVGDLGRIADDCHAAGAKAYLALNTIIYENELPKARRFLTAAKEAGIDAVIAWDFAVLRMAAEIGVPVHLSTQASVSNSESLAFFHETFGIRRFVLARECTLAQIRAMRKRMGEEVEVEVFAHGAMCVAVSGRCFMSESLCGKSANRGECQQPCRREYRVADEDSKAGFRVGRDYLLSPEDLCTLPFLDKLLDAGVASLKIEGRGRAPEYVDTVVRAYRQAVDFYCENKGRRGYRKEWQELQKELVEKLGAAFHRGMSSGFFMGKPLDQWTDRPGNRASHSKREIGKVVNYYRKASAMEVEVKNAEFRVGDEIMVQGPTTGVLRQVVESIQVEREEREVARRGENVAVRIDGVVRRQDRVFLVVNR
jgi:putative protease